MRIHLNPASKIPIYEQLVDRVKTLIATGELKPGDQLPTIRQLAVDLEIDPNTVARAYATLSQDGVISTQQGRGTFVMARPTDEHLAEHRARKLMALARALVLDARSLGYTLPEVRAAFTHALSEWQSESQKTEKKKER